LRKIGETQRKKVVTGFDKIARSRGAEYLEKLTKGAHLRKTSEIVYPSRPRGEIPLQ